MYAYNINGSGPLDAPLQQTMATDLGSLPGVVIRQVTQVGECIAQGMGIPYEQENFYTVSELPAGVRAARVNNEPGRWQPTGAELKALPVFMEVREESSFGTRCLMGAIGCLNLRQLKLHFYEHSGEPMTIDRPYKCGGCCCQPLEMTLLRGDRPLGKVVEDFQPYGGKCLEACCCCQSYSKVFETTPTGSLAHVYTARLGLSCCGRVNNCCGATCCKDNIIIDVLNPAGGLVSTVQVPYGVDEGCNACMRCAEKFK